MKIFRASCFRERAQRLSHLFRPFWAQTFCAILGVGERSERMPSSSSREIVSLMENSFCSFD